MSTDPAVERAFIYTPQAGDCVILEVTGPISDRSIPGRIEAAFRDKTGIDDSVKVLVLGDVRLSVVRK